MPMSRSGYSLDYNTTNILSLINNIDEKLVFLYWTHTIWGEDGLQMSYEYWVRPNLKPDLNIRQTGLVLLRQRELKIRNCTRPACHPDHQYDLCSIVYYYNALLETKVVVNVCSRVPFYRTQVPFSFFNQRAWSRVALILWLWHW